MESMQVAQILSDLTSLRACDYHAALALVSARPGSSSTAAPQFSSSSTTTTTAPMTSSKGATWAASEAGAALSSPISAGASVKEQQDDPDLARAKDLIELHYSVKLAHPGGEVDHDLRQAREAVQRAVSGL